MLVRVELPAAAAENRTVIVEVKNVAVTARARRARPFVAKERDETSRFAKPLRFAPDLVHIIFRKDEVVSLMGNEVKTGQVARKLVIFADAADSYGGGGLRLRVTPTQNGGSGYRANNDRIARRHDRVAATELQPVHARPVQHDGLDPFRRSVGHAQRYRNFRLRIEHQVSRVRRAWIAELIVAPDLHPERLSGDGGRRRKKLDPDAWRRHDPEMRGRLEYAAIDPAADRVDEDREAALGLRKRLHLHARRSCRSVSKRDGDLVAGK